MICLNIVYFSSKFLQIISARNANAANATITTNANVLKKTKTDKNAGLAQW